MGFHEIHSEKTFYGVLDKNLSERESFTLTFTTQMAFKRSGNDLETFLSRPNDFYSPEDPNAYRAKNFLSHAFGVENDESISFKRLSMQFDFVIIA